MARRMPWQAVALTLTAVTACYFSTTKPAAPECEHAAPAAPPPAELEVLIVGADGKVTKTTMPAPTLVLSPSKLKVEPLFRSLDAAKAFADGTEPVPVYALDPEGLAQRPCHEGADCVTPPRPPRLDEIVFMVFEPGSLEHALEGHFEPIGPNGQPPPHE